MLLVEMVLRHIATALAAIISVTALLAAISHILRKSPARYYRKASGFHRKGEYYYSIGDDELANEYYSEAEHYRSLAENMRGK